MKYSQYIHNLAGDKIIKQHCDYYNDYEALLVIRFLSFN